MQGENAGGAPIIAKLFEWYATGNYSLKALTEKAPAAGLTNRTSGRPLVRAKIHQILQNPIYCGDACLKHSGRVGRTAAAKRVDRHAVPLAVISHIRHAWTAYDELFSRGFDRDEARAEVDGAVRRVIAKWEA